MINQHFLQPDHVADSNDWKTHGEALARARINGTGAGGAPAAAQHVA